MFRNKFYLIVFDDEHFRYCSLFFDEHQLFFCDEHFGIDLECSGSESEWPHFYKWVSDSKINVCIKEWQELDKCQSLPPSSPFTGIPTVLTLTVHDVTEYADLFYVNELEVHIAVTDSKKYSRCQNISLWTDTTADKIWVFICVTLLQSIVKKPTYQYTGPNIQCLQLKYFIKHWVTSVSSAKKKCLHFSDNSIYEDILNLSPTIQLKINKMWPILGHLNRKFEYLCIRERDMTINKKIMLYKGKLEWMQLMPLKRVSFRVKTFMLCECETGYVWSIIIYIGKAQHLVRTTKTLSSQLRSSLTRLFKYTTIHLF